MHASCAPVCDAHERWPQVPALVSRNSPLWPGPKTIAQKRTPEPKKASACTSPPPDNAKRPTLARDYGENNCSAHAHLNENSENATNEAPPNPVLRKCSSVVTCVPPPRETTKGRTRGNGASIDTRAWLEVWDEHHRYAKHLRLYHKEWERVVRNKSGESNNNKVGGATCKDDLKAPEASNLENFQEFWDWLDPRDGRPGPSLPACPRALLEHDTVYYCTTATERRHFAFTWYDGKIVQAHGGSLEYVTTGDHGWIFVLRDGVMYGRRKKTSTPRFHHSSFFAGECVMTAGLLVAKRGVLTRLYPHSGHYRPSEEQLLLLLKFLDGLGVVLEEVEVDVQRILKVARLASGSGEKKKKMESPYFWPGDKVLDFLKLKERSKRRGVLAQIRREPVPRDAVEAPNEATVPFGSVWRNIAAKPRRTPTCVEPTPTRRHPVLGCYETLDDIDILPSSSNFVQQSNLGMALRCHSEPPDRQPRLLKPLQQPFKPIQPLPREHENVINALLTKPTFKRLERAMPEEKVAQEKPSSLDCPEENRLERDDEEVSAIMRSTTDPTFFIGANEEWEHYDEHAFLPLPPAKGRRRRRRRPRPRLETMAVAGGMARSVEVSLFGDSSEGEAGKVDDLSEESVDSNDTCEDENSATSPTPFTKVGAAEQFWRKMKRSPSNENFTEAELMQLDGMLHRDQQDTGQKPTRSCRRRARRKSATHT